MLDILALPALALNQNSTTAMTNVIWIVAQSQNMGSTATEKMLEAASPSSDVQAGDTVEVNVGLSWVHETQLEIFRDVFEEMGGEVWNRSRVRFMIDHFPTPATDEQANRLQSLRDYASEKEIKVVKAGIKHQAWRMLGLARPGLIMAGPDSHTPTAGALGAFATAVGPTDTAVIWNEGKLWVRVPETIQFNLVGELEPYVTPRDVGFAILEEYGKETDYFANEMTVEYAGELVSDLSLDGRQTLCNMATEMGATNAFIPPDETLQKEYLDPMVDEPYEAHTSDQDADFVAQHELHVNDLGPKVAFPHSPANVRDIGEAAGRSIDRLFLGSCANGHLSDLKLAASILEGKEINQDVDLLVAPASDKIRRQASEQGIIDTLMQAGAKISSGYCSACPGYEGVLASGERCLSTSTRNYQGRMGHRDSEIYLASPAVIAASAIQGEITDPRGIDA